MCNLSILECHKAELASLLEEKNNGVTEVPVVEKFLKKDEESLFLFCMKEMPMIPIDEAIRSWAEPIADMESGADQEQYDY